MTPRYHLDVEQGTPEWDALRAGKWSASNAATIMGKLTNSGLEELIKDVAWERVFGPANEGRYYGRAMQRGHEVEPEARDWFAFERDVVVVECGMVEHAEIPHVSWSPDGLHAPASIVQGHERVGPRWLRGIEGKAPMHRAFMDMLRSGEIPPEYRWQCRWACWVGHLEAIDFVGYHPRLGGRVIECSITEADRDQMAARVYALEKRVAEWVDILQAQEALA